MIPEEVFELFFENGITEEDLEENEVMFFDDRAYDSAILGLSTDYRVIYDYDLMVLGLMQDYQMTVEDAMDWLGYNTLRSLDYISHPNKPIIMNTFKGYERI